MNDNRWTGVGWIIEGLAKPGKSRAGLARAMGVDKSAVTRLLKGERRLLAEELPIVQEYLEVGPFAPAVRDAGQAAIDEIDALIGAGPPGIGHTERRRHVGGGITIGADEVKARWELPESYIRRELGVAPERVQIIEVRGDSMHPTLEPGDRVMVDTVQATPSPDGIYALFDGDGVVVKRLELVPGSDPRSVRVISDNRNYPPYERTLEGVRVIGRVIWRATKL